VLGRRSGRATQAAAPRLTQAAPAPPREGSGRETRWVDDYGTVAFGWRDGSHSSMRLPGVGVYRWDESSEAVTAIPEPGAGEEAVVDTYRRCVLPMVLQTRGIQVLHASAVLLPDGVLALCARSRTGKSTLAFALSRELDRPLWADDAVAFEPSPWREVRSIPLPFSLKLREQSAEHFGVAAPPAPPPPPRVAPLRALFTLSRSESLEAPRVERLSPARAFTALLEHAYCFDVDDPAPRGPMVGRYLELGARVPAFELRFPTDLELLPATLAEIERALR
jgi:hypothetical protein